MKKIKNKIIAIIPAREGSKGIPRKNIKPLVGKPLISYTIEQAKKSKYIDKLIVSTDDKKIAEISEKWGVEIIQRPKNLAKDRTKIIDVIFHSLAVLKKENYIPDIIILLQPTSPLRKCKDIDRALEIFLKEKADGLISISEAKTSPYWFFKINKKKYLKPLFSWDYFRRRRQDLPRIYSVNGALFISTLKTLVRNKSFYSNKMLYYIMPTERSIDIDDKIDFYLAELIIKNNQNERNKK